MDRYVSAHISPRGPGDAGPTAEQIIDDQGHIGKLTDKVILITGGFGFRVTTQVWAAVAKELEGKGGMFLNDAQVVSEADANAKLFPSCWRPHIWNKENAARLWGDSLKMVGM
jgi:hypothetical protein